MNTEAVKMNAAELTAAVIALQAQVADLTAQIEALRSTPVAAPKAESVEMTDDHARSVLFGDLAAVKHKDAAEKLGLTYGQVYSCRKEFTFKHIHKEMKESGKTNTWTK